MRTCEEIQELISRSFDEEMTAEERSAIQTHIRSCEQCRAFNAAIEKNRSLLAELKVAAPRHENAFVTEEKPQSWWKRRIAVPIPVAAAVLFGLILWGIAGHVHSPRSVPDESRPEVRPLVKTVQYIEIDRLAPQSAQPVEKTTSL